MKRFGIPNDRDEGDVVANCRNAAKTSMVGTKHGCLRSTKQKRRIRTQMNKLKRVRLKTQLKNEIKNMCD